MKRLCLGVATAVMVFGCVSGPPDDSSPHSSQEDFNFGSYRYGVDEFTGRATLTYETFFFPGYSNIHVSYTTGQGDILLVFRVVESDWIFADRVLYLVDDSDGELPVDSFSRDVTPRGNVFERVFVYMSEEQLSRFQTDQEIRFSLRGSRGRQDTHPMTTGPVFQEMLWRIVAAKPYLDAGESVPAELLDRFFSSQP